ncbi:MAG: NUDIX domain-containing protein [Sphingomonas sp.]|nr:NUDIX domain-containing protein [Sphingomonas sp.]
MLFNDQGELVLIRNSYGRSDLFVLPGGGIRPFEEPAAAATREVGEELGVGVTDLSFRSLHFSRAEGKRDEIHLFEARVSDRLSVDDFELAEARFVPLGDLPQTTSPATRRRIEEYLGVRELDEKW